MGSVRVTELRHRTAEVLRRVSNGEELTTTVNGETVAEICPVRHPRPRFMSRAELIELADHHLADAGLWADLEIHAGDTTDDLGPTW